MPARISVCRHGDIRSIARWSDGLDPTGALYRCRRPDYDRLVGMSPAFQVVSVAELAARREAERNGLPFLIFRNAAGQQQVVALEDSRHPVPIGRAPEDGGIQLDDATVSRVHA